MTRLSCHHSRSNEVRLWLSVLAYNLGNLWRRLVLPKRIDHSSLTNLQQRLVKTGGRLIKHAYINTATVPIVRECLDICELTRRGLLPEDWVLRDPVPTSQACVR
jgi:hypothetical protein